MSGYKNMRLIFFFKDLSHNVFLKKGHEVILFTKYLLFFFLKMSSGNDRTE